MCSEPTELAHMDRVEAPGTVRFLRNHRLGAVVRSCASLALWLAAIVADLLGILDKTQFLGVSVAVACVVFMNLPLLWIANRLHSRVAYELFSIAVHALEIVGYTAVIHFVGGLDAAFLTPIYCGMITYVGVIAPRRHLFLVAGMSAFAFCTLVMLEYYHVLESYPLFGGFPAGRPPWAAVSVVLAVSTVLLFTVAIISARTTDLLREGRARLRLQKDQLELEVEARKVTEGKLRALVDEKQLLLKEVHHRVKNNLQVISSLLRMQADGIDDDRVRAALTTTHARVASMAMVHEMFYKSGDLDHVDLEPFLRNLTAFLTSAFDLEGGPIRVEMDLESVEVGLDAAIRVGLVVNEMVSNVLKHAFPERDAPGLLEIHMRVDSTSAEVTVADNGCGLPEGLDWTSTESLGLQLVQNVARQLHGTIRLDSANGTAFHLRFPISGALEMPAEDTV